MPYSYIDFFDYEYTTPKLLICILRPKVECDKNVMALNFDSTQFNISPCTISAYFEIFHVKIAQKWPKTHDPFPWQPDMKVTNLIPAFEFLH